MSSWRRWIDAVAIPVVVLLLAGGWYGARSHIVLYLDMLYGESMMLDPATIGRTLVLMTVATLGGYLLGGLGAIALGPLPVAVFGSLLCAAGTGTIGLAGERTVLIPILMASVGYGIAVPACYAAAARHFGRGHGQLRNALFVILWVSVNVGALLGPGLTVAARTSLGHAAAFSISAVMLVLAALVAAAAFGGGWYVGHEDAHRDRGFTIDKRVALLSGGVVLLAFLPWALVLTVYDHLWSNLFQLGFDGSTMDYSSLMQINPIAIIVLGIFLAPVFVVFHATRFDLPTIFPIGLGFLLLGLGAAPLLFTEVMTLLPVLVVALLVLAAGEILVGPLLLSQISAGWSWRLSTLAMALWFILVRGVNLGINALQGIGDGDQTTQAAVWLGIMLCGIVGLTFAIAAWPLRKLLGEYAPAED